MNTDTYLNSPVKSCQTCVHFRTGAYDLDMFNYCGRFETYCTIAVDFRCTPALKDWRPIPPKPPRRSLRQWLYDTFWA